METIGHLLGLGSPFTCSLSIGPCTVTTNHFDSGMSSEPSFQGLSLTVRQHLHNAMSLQIFLLVSVLYLISHLFERRSPVSHVRFEQTQPCLRHRSGAVRNPQHALCVWFSVRAQRTTRTRRAECLL